MNTIQNWIFNRVHGGKLIYNTCWEDPRCDRKLLQLDQESEIVMITSAGDNALDYLLDDPAKIHTIDMNYRQNALLDLKRSMLKNESHEMLFDFFGKGNVDRVKKVYKNKLRVDLPDYAQEYWDKHINYFRKKGLRQSFYFRGTSGILAWCCRNYIYMQKSVRRGVRELLNSKTIQEQIEIYHTIEQKIFTPFVNRLLNQHFTMVLAGVPKAQQTLMQEDFEGGNVEYIKQSFRNIFTQLAVSDNYFYQVYFNGHYTKDCCPEYLKENNFVYLSARENRISSYTSTLSDFLIKNPGQYSHYVLLDHQDWLAAHDVPALEEEWQLILKNSKPGTRILLRSAAAKVDFFPEFITDKIKFQTDLTEAIHQEDRVGTYASVYLGIVQ